MLPEGETWEDAVRVGRDAHYYNLAIAALREIKKIVIRDSMYREA